MYDHDELIMIFRYISHSIRTFVSEKRYGRIRI